MTNEESRRRHPSNLRLVAALDPAEVEDNVALVVAVFDGDGEVIQYLYNRPADFQHRHLPSDYRKWDITHEFHPDINAHLCIRTALPVTTSP